MRGVGIFGATFGGEIGNFVEDEGAHESKIAPSTGKDSMLTVGVPLLDAVFEFRRAIELDFLRTLNGPVFKDVVAAR